MNVERGAQRVRGGEHKWVRGKVRTKYNDKYINEHVTMKPSTVYD